MNSTYSIMPRMTDTQALEQFRIALENATANTTISAALAATGYEESVLNEGKALLEAARKAYTDNITEDDESKQAYHAFETKRDELDALYRLHRKKAKILYRNEPVVSKTLGITGRVPDAYIVWLDTIKRFYTTAESSEEIKSQLATLAVSAQDITDALSSINELESTRSEYLREKGESQEATQTKDQAIGELSSWMSDFYAVARIALEDQPQLMEALGKVVR